MPKTAKCNGKNDCADSSDEKIPECLKGPTDTSQSKPNKLCQ